MCDVLACVGTLVTPDRSGEVYPELYIASRSTPKSPLGQGSRSDLSSRVGPGFQATPPRLRMFSGFVELLATVLFIPGESYIWFDRLRD